MSLKILSCGRVLLSDTDCFAVDQTLMLSDCLFKVVILCPYFLQLNTIFDDLQSQAIKIAVSSSLISQQPRQLLTAEQNKPRGTYFESVISIVKSKKSFEFKLKVVVVVVRGYLLPHKFVERGIIGS
jgi:hypothetical protein